MPQSLLDEPVPQTLRDTKQSNLYPHGVGVKNHYAFMPGVCILPLAEDPPTDPSELRAWSPVVKLVLHAPYRIRRLVYEVPVKQNNPPVLPTPRDTGAFVFISGVVSAVTMVNQNYVCSDWTMGCEYFFVENCVSRPEDGLVLGSPGIDLANTVDNMDTLSQNPNPKFYGASYYSGLDAVQGLQQGDNINLDGAWGYNSIALYPGNLFCDDLANGGPPRVPRTIS